ncbi:ribonuclease H [Endothiovibrio diazotrophicus]
MAQENWKVKEGVTLTAEEVAKIACALKSLAVYTSMACEHEDDPEDLTAIVQEGLDAIDNLFET